MSDANTATPKSNPAVATMNSAMENQAGSVAPHLRIVSDDEKKERLARNEASRRQPVDLQGWDTVAAISYSKLNSVIEAQAKYPSTFDYDLMDEGKVEASVRGNCGTWQLALSAEAGIHLMIPLSDVVVEIGEMQHTAKQGSAIIQVDAIFVQQVTDPNKKDLKINPQSPVSGVSANIDFGDPLVNSAFPTMFQGWCNAHADMLVAIFSTVDFNADYKQPQMKWIAPNVIAFAASTPTQPTMDNCSLGVLAMIGGAPIDPKMAAQYSPLVIPESCDAGFAISRDNFIKQMLLPAAPLMFAPDETGFPAIEAFQQDPTDASSITNCTPVKLQPLQMPNGFVVSPELDNGGFKLAVEGELLHITLTDAKWTDEYRLMDVTLNYDAEFYIVFDEKTQTLAFGKPLRASCHITATPTQDALQQEHFFAIATIVLSLIGVVAGICSWAVAGAEAADAAGGVAVSAEAVGEAGGAASAAGSDLQGFLSGFETINALKFVVQSIRVGVGIPLRLLPLPFLTIAKVGMLFAGVTGLSLAVQKMDISDVEEEIRNLQFSFKSTAEDALRKTVIWPDTAGEFALETIEVNESLQFGFKAVGNA